jgi:hypothetical protein
MAFSLEQLLGYVYLTGLIEAIKTGIPDLLPAEFKTIKKDTLKDMGRYTRVAGTRRTARRIEYGAPTRKRTLKEVGIFDVKLNTAGENIQLDLETFMALRAYDSYQVQNLGMQELERQALQFRTLFDNLDLAMTYSMLANGAIWFDGSGNLLPSSAGAVITISYGMNPNHQNQANGILTLGWQNAGADIPTMILALKDQALFDTGYELGCSFYGRSIPSYFANNALMVEYLARNQRFRDHFLETNEIPDGLFGLKWYRVSAAFYDSSLDGTTQGLGTNQIISTFFSTSAVVLTPPVEQAWYENMHGQIMVPTTFNPFTSLQGAAGSFDIKTKMGMWAVPTFNPIAAEMHVKMVNLPILKFPDSIFELNVNF